MPLPRSVTISINGEPRELSAATLEQALRELGYGDAKLATALNGDFVPARRRGETALTSGDRIEILTARQGG